MKSTQWRFSGVWNEGNGSVKCLDDLNDLSLFE
jgi:hypothetical protein